MDAVPTFPLGDGSGVEAPHERTRRAVDDDLAALMDLIGAGKIKPVIDKVLPLEEAREGLRLIQDREVIGKVVVTP